jgi:hypothetical protein
MSHALVPTWVGNNTQPSAVVRIPFQPRLQFHATHSSTASPVDKKPSRWSSPSRARMVQAGIDEADEP